MAISALNFASAFKGADYMNDDDYDNDLSVAEGIAVAVIIGLCF